MTTAYQELEFRNNKFHTGQVLDGEKYSNSSKTSTWFVKITCKGTSLTSCNDKNFGSDHCPLLDHMYSISRRTNANIVEKDKKDSSRVRFSNPLIKIPNDVWTVELERILIKATIVEEINLKRMTNADDVNLVAQEIKFEKNILQDIRQDDDYVWLEFRTSKYTNTMTRRDQDGIAAGVNDVTYSIPESDLSNAGGGGGSEQGVTEVD